jgi:hypothetical protein
LRRRLHVNTLITEPGTMEIEWGGAYSFTTGSYSLPTTIKYTPEGTHAYWGRTEFSASFDTLSSVVQYDDRITEFSDRLTLAATCVVHDGAKLDIAVAPLVSFFLRDEDGVRGGAAAIARYDWGRNSAGLTAAWTGATTASASNPAGSLDLGGGYGRRLAASGLLAHFTAHGNFLVEKSTGIARQVSLFEGFECQFTDKVALDVSSQHFSVSGGQRDQQLVVGLTVNLGRLRGARR